MGEGRRGGQRNALSTASRPVREAHRPQIHGLSARRVRPRLQEPVSINRGRREHTLARYGQAFKDRAVARLLPPQSAALDDVSREIGIGVDKLARWRSVSAEVVAGAPAIADFVASLASAWRDGEARPTHRKQPAAKHWRKTQVDPFADASPVVEEWLIAEPAVSAKALM